jgi:hypothetical protein
MQPKVFTTSLFLTLSAGSLGSLASAQEALPDLARARTAFASADADGSGGLSQSEAISSGHSQAEFRGFDLDGDGALTQNEFIVGFKERMSAGGRRVAPDLENEARRILTERRAAQADEARRREEAAGQGPAARRSEAVREKIRTSGVDPLRVRSHAGEQGAGESGGANAGTDPRSRATGALRELNRKNETPPAPANGAQPNANAVPPGATPNAGSAGTNNAGGPNAGPAPARPAPGANAGSNASNAPPASQGPAARRTNPDERISPEELQRLFRQRRERAAAESHDDPRVEAERERAQERSSANGQGSSGSSGSEDRGSAERGASNGSTGTSRGTTARPAPARPRGGGL